MAAEITYEKALIVTVGENKYSFDIAAVEGVLLLEKSRINPVPFDTSGRIAGIFNYKGDIAVLIRDEKFPFSFESNKNDRVTLVVLKYDNKRFAIAADNVSTSEISENPKQISRINVGKLYSGEAR